MRAKTPGASACKTHPRRGGAPRRLIAAAAAVLLTSCGGDSRSDRDAPDLKTIDEAALQQTVEKVARELLVPGAVVVLQTPKGNFTSTYGVTTYKGSVPTTTDQHVRIGSNTKTWTGTVILQQVQEGLLSLDDRVSKYISGVPNGDNITIEHLLTMRSGLFNYSVSREFNQELDDEPQKIWTPAELLALAFQTPPDPPYAAPGAAFLYSNTNTILLGLIAEKRENGKPLDAIMNDRLFKPLGMKGTALLPPSSSVLPQPFARGYMYGDNVSTMQALPPDVQAAAQAGTLAPGDQTDASVSWGWSAGSGYSTANELAAWVKAMVGGRLLNRELQARRLASLRPLSPTSPPESPQYGWGIAKFRALYGHTGEIPGYNAFMGHDPENNVTLVVWTNLGPSPNLTPPATEIALQITSQIYEPR